MTWLLTVAAVAGCSQRNAVQKEQALPLDNHADLIVTNALIWTGDPSRPAAAAFAVRDGRFVFVGDDHAAWRGPDAHTVDAGGLRILPGLIDAHMHLISGGLLLSRLNLRDAADRAAFIEAVAARARTLRPGEWLLGGGWSTESWPDSTQPTKEWIDPVSPDNPVLLRRMDIHGALANSAALKIAGIDRDGPADPPGGKIERDPRTGEPTGILKEAATELVSKHVPPVSRAQQLSALKAAIREAHRHGLTAAHTMSAWSDLAVLDEARAAGELTLRVRFCVSEDDWRAFIPKARDFQGDARLRVFGLKQFADGSLGSRTAYMAEPFSDNPPEKADWRGLLGAALEKPGELQRMCNAVDAAGFGSVIHAIGDQANHLVLDAYAEAQRVNGPRPDRCMRIEHAQHLLPGDIGRFASLGVIASMQPLHKADDGRYAEKAVGAERCRTSYAFRGLLDAGACLAFGSDWPVVSLDPFQGLHAAVTGRTLDGKVFVPEQNITVEEALRAYTAGGARAGGDEDRLGRIAPGYFADFVLLDSDVLAAAGDDLTRVTVKETYVGGRRVWPAE